MIILFLIYGLIIGSFLNVCIYRIPLNISVAKGRSYCPHCKHTLNALDLVPVFSFLFLRGRCRYCKEGISPRYAMVELVTAVLYALAYVSFGWGVDAILGCLLISTLIIVSFIDIDTFTIPDRLHLVILILAIIRLFIYKDGLLNHLLGIVIIALPMLVIAYFTNGFGGGDIKLMGVVGLYLGSPLTVLAFFVSILTGGIYGTMLLVFKKANRKSKLAFGPFLCLGIVVSLLFGDTLISFYLSLFFK